MAKKQATSSKGSSKGSKGNQPTAAPTAPTAAPKGSKGKQAALVPAVGTKHNGSLGKGLVVPEGYQPTARAVAAAVAKQGGDPKAAVNVACYGRLRHANVPWCSHAAALLWCLERLGKPSGSTAIVAYAAANSAALAKAAPGGKVTARNVRHYAYHAATGGYVEVTAGNGIGYAYGITTKGKAALKAGKWA